MSLSWTFLWTRWELAPIDWGAIAILFTGIAALVVGRRQIGILAEQAKIQAQQTEILAGQNKLKENEIKVSLLDRRLSVIRGFRDFGTQFSGTLTGALWDGRPEFIRLIREAELIFPEALVPQIKEIIEVSASALVWVDQRDWPSQHVSQVSAYDERAKRAQNHLLTLLMDLIPKLLAHASVNLEA